VPVPPFMRSRIDPAQSFEVTLKPHSYRVFRMQQSK